MSVLYAQAVFKGRVHGFRKTSCSSNARSCTSVATERLVEILKGLVQRLDKQKLDNDAMRALRRQRRVVGLVDLRRDAPLGMGTVLFPRLASRLLRLRDARLPRLPPSAWRLAQAKSPTLAAVGHS